MAEEGKLKEFPDVNHKLAAPKKLSAFEKERQAAQAKERRAEAENAAALKAFEDSFADEHDYEDSLPRRDHDRGPPPPPGPRGGFVGGYGGTRGRFDGPQLPRSGPGSLGPMPGPPPPPSLKRKRALDEMRELQEARREQGMLHFEDTRGDSRETPKTTLAQDDDGEVDAPRPTIQLSSLPPATSVNDIEELLHDHVKVSSVHFLPATRSGANTKRSTTAIATLESDISTSQIDTAVSALKDKYLGCGFYLSISRHLSSASVHPSLSTTTSTQSTEPFGAEIQKDTHPRFSMRNAPPPLEHRGFAPPPDLYHSPSHHPGQISRPNNTQPEATITIHPPASIQEIKAIHTLLDRLHLETSPTRILQLEALLMSLPEVQSDPRFAFLYSSRSQAGLYYRFLLWDPVYPDESARELKRRACAPERVFEDWNAEWLPPYVDVPFPNLQSLEQVVTDMDYISSDEDSEDEDASGGRFYSGGAFGSGYGDGGMDVGGERRKGLNPLKRARLVSLLARLPTSHAKLRKGDMARVTNFAIVHAGARAEEVVDLLLLNVRKPFSYSLASRYEEDASDGDGDGEDEEDVYEPNEELATLDSPAPHPQPTRKDKSGKEKRDEDPSNAKLIALYLISDILSASSTAGARNAWKYRQLFESGLKSQRTFEHLGRLEKELDWGRLKSEQWKRKVGALLGVWEGWSVFGAEVLEGFRGVFLEPPLSAEERVLEEERRGREEKERKVREEGLAGKLKRVGEGESGSASPAPVSGVGVGGAGGSVIEAEQMDDVDGKPMDEDIDGKPMDDVDGKPMDDIDGKPMDDIDGVPMDDVDGVPMDADKAGPSLATAAASTATAASVKAAAPRKRMRAEDMFAESDDEE